jgi:hypothetical protein
MSAPAFSSAWNVTRYPGQLSWTVHRYANGDPRRLEWLRNAAGQVMRLRSAAAAVAAAAQANGAEQPARDAA